MNSLRSTECRLLKLAVANVTKKRKASSLAPKLLVKRHRPSLDGSKIILKELNNISQKNTIDFSKSENLFFNPNKPSIKKQLSETMIPLTCPTFSKGSKMAPSVTKVLQATMPAASRFILDRWRETMIKKLGIVGFNKYQQDTFQRGTILHGLIAHYLLGRGEPDQLGEKMSKEVVSNLWKSINSLVKDKISNVRLVEHTVVHPELNYRGIVDCVAYYEDELVVIDFKTAEKPKKNLESLYDNPIQVSAYCGALNNDKSLPDHVIDRNIDSGVVIVAYTDGSQASAHHLRGEDIVSKYWKQWTSRLEQFAKMNMIDTVQ